MTEDHIIDLAFVLLGIGGFGTALILVSLVGIFVESVINYTKHSRF